MTTRYALRRLSSAGRATLVGAAAALVMSLGFGTATSRAAEDGPTVLKRTVIVNVHRYTRYWKSATASEPVYKTWSWTPKMTFEVLGPIPAGAKFYVDFTRPDGSLWFSELCNTPAAEAEERVTIETPDEDALEKKAILTAGTFGFKIRLKNALEGTNNVLFSGKYHIKTYVPAGNVPDYKDKHEFYVDNDWRIPIGYLYLNPSDDKDIPFISLQLWFRGPIGGTDMEGFLYYNGKLINHNKSTAETVTIDTGVGDAPYRWAGWTFSFPRVKAFNHSTQDSSQTNALFFLDKNPGDYEVKVLEKGELARSVKFSVGADGNIVDNGISTKNHLGGKRMVVPVKVIGSMDHNWNTMAWQTDAFYGNPLVGFTAP